MGLFISTCKGCKKDISWFLTAYPHDCKCGTYMTAEEVELSWDENYFNRMVEHCLSRLMKGETTEAHIKGFNKDFGTQVVDEARKRYDNSSKRN